MTKPAQNKVLHYTGWYTGVLIVSAVAFQWGAWCSLPPASIHQWRQADGQSIAWHYGQHPAFSEVAIQNLFQAGDPHTMGELPALYWLAGLITHYIGGPDYPLRWLGLAILAWGGWALGRLWLDKTGTLQAALLAGCFISAPILAYYGPSFLPDAPAFFLMCGAAMCIYYGKKRQKPAWLLPGAALSALSLCLKLSMAIFPLALIGAWVLNARRKGRLPVDKWTGTALFVGFLAVFGCRAWIHEYRQAHHAIYFLAGTRPIWDYDVAFILETLRMALRMGVPNFGATGLYLLTAAGLLFIIKNWKSITYFDKTLFLLSLSGSLAYCLLWFRMLREHDYYLICLLVVPAVIWWIALPRAFAPVKARAGTLLLFVCWLLSMAHTGWLLQKRLQWAFFPDSAFNLPVSAFLKEGALTVAGIPDSARIWCPQDPSPNIALLALKRFGWSGYNFGVNTGEDTLSYYQQRLGLSHLALRDTGGYTPVLRSFFPKKVYEANGWVIFAR